MSAKDRERYYYGKGYNPDDPFSSTYKIVDNFVGTIDDDDDYFYNRNNNVIVDEKDYRHHLANLPQPITYAPPLDPRPFTDEEFKTLTGGQLALIGGNILKKIFGIASNIVGKVYNGAKKLIS